jgi:hypothetical protein
MRRKLFLLLALLVAMAPAAASGQRSTSGTFGQRNIGGTLGGSQSSAFGGGGSGGGAASGFGGAGGAAGNQQDAGQVSGNERFIRGARQPGQFVGSDQTDYAVVGQQNAGGGAAGGRGALGAGMMGRGGTGQLGGMFGQQGFNQFNRNGLNQLQNNMGRGGQTRKQLRTQIQLGFGGPSAVAGASARTTTQFERRLTKIPQLTVTGPVRVSMEGSTAVIEGFVASENDRDLAGRLALLEPGIADVRNELIVRPASASAEPLPPPEPGAVVTPPVNPASRTAQ